MADQMSQSPSFNHKIAVPQAQRNAVTRDALLERVFGPIAPRIVTFQGPAGHGKTSLMVQVEAACRRHDMAAIWISLDESDNDVSRLIGTLQEAVSLHAPSKSSSLRGGSTDEQGVQSRVGWIAAQLLELDRPVAVFLDDLHTVTSRPALIFLGELLSRVPGRVRWFLASRSTPEIGLSRLLVSGDALAVRADELCFSLAEAEQFFELREDLDLSDGDVATVHGLTEGWPAALQLFRLTLGSKSVRDSLKQSNVYQPRELTDYLGENVLSRQDAQTREFLLKTSCLTRMSGPLCDAILGIEGSHETLSTLESLGLFVRRLESDGVWFTYHGLFASFLQEHLRNSRPNASTEIHRRAAAWYREHGYYEEALHHYSSAGDHSEAAEVFETWADRLVPDGHMETVAHWSDSVPISELRKRPGLVIKLVWALTFLSRHRKLAPLLPILENIEPDAAISGNPVIASSMVALLQDDLARGEAIVSNIDPEQETTSRFGSFELSAVANARGYRAMAEGRFDQALESLALGRALGEKAGATFTTAYSIAKVGLSHMAQGRLQEAVVLFRSALADPGMYIDESVSEASLVCGLIAALYECDDLDGAMELYQQFHDTLINVAIHDYLVISYVTVARILDTRDERNAALEVLDEAERLAYSAQWPRAVSLINWERVRRELIIGQTDRAGVLAGWISDDGANADPDWVRLSEETDGPILGRLRLMIYSGQAADALQEAHDHLRRAEGAGRLHRQIKLNILITLAHKQLHDVPAAHRTLASALELAAPGGYLRCFLDEGEGLGGLLLEHVQAVGRGLKAAASMTFLNV
jgi:LuxR family transcriptional regulator, maltose regulon positive regulatory protein